MIEFWWFHLVEYIKGIQFIIVLNILIGEACGEMFT